MRRSFNKLFLGAVIAAIGAVGAVNTMAQDDAEKNALYTKFTACYKAQDDPGIAACIAVGKEYLQKYGTPPDQFNEFVNKQIPNLEKRPAQNRIAEAYKKLQDGITSKNWAKAFEGGRDVIKVEPRDSLKLDVSILMAEIGYDLAFGTPPDNTYNAEAMNYAKSALRMIESGTVSESRAGANNTTIEPFWGGGGNYALKSKDNASAWMNFIIGRLISDTNKDTTKNLALYREAAPYYYKATKFESPDIKKSPIPYQNIGRYYLEEMNSTVDRYDKTCKNLTEDTPECKNIREMQLAYAERGLDAYARAAKIAKDDPKQPQTFRDTLNKRVSDFYNARFKKPDGMADYVNKMTTQPLADPSTTVAPIPEPPIETSTAPGTKPASTTPAGTVKPAATTPASTVKPAATTPASTTKPASTTPASTTKPAATPAKPSGSKGKGTVAKSAAKKKSGR